MHDSSLSRPWTQFKSIIFNFLHMDFSNQGLDPVLHNRPTDAIENRAFGQLNFWVGHLIRLAFPLIYMASVIIYVVIDVEAEGNTKYCKELDSHHDSSMYDSSVPPHQAWYPHL